MESLQSRLASASLADNLADITRQIQASPASADLRAAFVQLLCLAGNWTRAQNPAAIVAGADAPGAADRHLTAAGHCR